MTRLPPLETLRVFEVACRHGSYSEAARELHVTHSAVSQRIRQLEDELGLTLFERQGNRMAPTSSGLRLQAGVKSAFSELGAALGSLQTRRTDAEVTVSLLPVMAARWLVPRLSRFKARFPRINLHVKSAQSLANYELVIQNAFRDVDDALADLRHSAELRDTLQRRVAALQRSVTLANVRYDNGYSDYLDVLDAERSLFSAQLQLASARGDYQRALVSLYRALGGDWTTAAASAHFKRFRTRPAGTSGRRPACRTRSRTR